MTYMPLFSPRAPAQNHGRYGYRPPAQMPRFLTPLPALIRPVNTATYVSSLINSILLRLNENANSNAFNLETGTAGTGAGGTPAIGATGAILEYLNEAASDLARNGGYTIYGTATYTALPAGTTTIPLNHPNLATGDTSVLWAVREVSWGGTPLTHCDLSRLSLQKALIANTPPPAYWYRLGAEGIGIYPTPTTVQPLVATGLVIPPLLSYTGDRPSWLMDDLVKLLEWYVCAQVAKKNTEDPSLAARFAEWDGPYQEGKQALLARLWAVDPGLAQAHYAMPMGAGRGK